MRLLLPHASQRAVTRTKDRVIRQGKNIFAVGLESVGIGNAATTHRTGEHRMAHDCNPVRQSQYDIGNSTTGMTFGLSGFNLERSNCKLFPSLKRLCAIKGFEFADENRSLRNFSKPSQIGNVIGMRV